MMQQQSNHDEKFKEIVEKFVELKNTSELMIDLAYSSLLLNSKELAEGVYKLEEYVDKLHIEYELAVLSSKFKEEEAKGILGLIRLGVVTEEIADAAAEIAEVVLREIEPHPVMKLVIEEADETATYVRVSEGSPLVNKTLKEARIQEETGMQVLAIKRGDRYLRPKPDLTINIGDVIIASGFAEGEENLKKLASPSGLEESSRAE
ncbi:MAG: TrkA C-terminal domain-containing protein [Thermoproteota archaeon]